MASLMEKIDLETFRNKHEENQLRSIRSSDGETLLDVARKKFMTNHIRWLKSIGVSSKFFNIIVLLQEVNEAYKRTPSLSGYFSMVVLFTRLEGKNV